MDVGERRAVDEGGPDSVKDQLESAEERLSKERVKHEGFHGSGEISVETGNA